MKRAAMPTPSRCVPIAKLATVCALSGALAACGADSFELRGGVFDALGVSTKAMNANRTEKKLAARPGIVMPPDTKRLPPPGSGASAAPPSDKSWPVSPEDRANQKRAALEAKQKAICEAWEKRKAIDENVASGPLGSCDPGIGEKLFGTYQPAETTE